jgi:DNA sulfur modification protein DndB
MGDWTYYLFTISFSHAAAILKFAYEVNHKTDLDHLIQRELTARSHEIAEYLQHQPQRLFGSLICASFGEDIDFTATSGNVGRLTLSSASKVYVLDGQHRLAAIKETVLKKPARYQDDHVAVLLVKHDTNNAGYKRARRLFTTVNRYAKQTAKATNRVMDEDDGTSFLLLRFIREFSFYCNHIKCSRKNKKGQTVLFQSESMSAADGRYLMSVSSFYEVIYNLMPTQKKPLFSKRQKLPEVNILDDVYGEVDIRLDEICRAVRPWRELKAKTISDLNTFRSPTKGHPLVRPVAIIPFCLAFNEAAEAGITILDIEAIVNKYSDITQRPWAGVLWNSATRRMYGGQEVKRLTHRLWRLLLGVATETEKAETIAAWKSRVDPQGLNPELKSPLLP